MKNAWNRNVRMMSARTNAMRMSPGTSPRNPRNPLLRRLPGSSAPVPRSRSVQPSSPCQGYRSSVRHEPQRNRCRVFRAGRRDLDGLERRPDRRPLAQSEPGDRPRVISATTGGAPASRTRARSPSIAISAIRPRTDVARGPLRLRGVQHHVGRAEHAEHAVDAAREGRSLGHGPTTSPSSVTTRARPVVERLQRPCEQVHAHQVGHVRRSRGVAELLGRAASA